MNQLKMSIPTQRMGDALRAYAKDVGVALAPPKKSEWQQQLEEGERVELLVARYLRSLGYAVQSLASADCQARPEIITPELDYQGCPEVLCQPDLLVFGAGLSPLYVEVKLKDKVVRWGQREETGIDAEAYCEYQRISAATGLPIVLWFVHRQQREGVYSIPLSRFSASLRFWGGTAGTKRHSRPLVFCDFKELDWMCSLEELGLTN